METVASPNSDRKGEVQPEDVGDAQCDEAGTKNEADATTAPIEHDNEIVIAPAVSDRVAEMLGRFRRLRELCDSHGSPGVDVAGKPIPKTPAGFDHAYLLALAQAGVTDRAELATALHHRGGDQGARDPSIEHIIQIVSDVLESLTPKPPEAALGVTFERLKIYGTQPATYALTVDGTTVELSASALLSVRRMRIILMDALHRIPDMPKDAEEWETIVETWLAEAEVIDLPPEAVEAVHLREQVARAVADHIPGRRREDLDRGRSLQVEAVGVVFKSSLVERALKREQTSVPTRRICKALNELGFESDTPRIDGKKTRVWTAVSPRARALVAGEAIDDDGPGHDATSHGKPPDEVDAGGGQEREEHVP